MNYNSRISIKGILLTFVLLFCSFGLMVMAQTQSLSISGTVADEYGTPVEGVTVTTDDGKFGTITNRNGDYMILLNEKSKYL